MAELNTIAVIYCESIFKFVFRSQIVYYKGKGRFKQQVKKY